MMLNQQKTGVNILKKKIGLQSDPFSNINTKKPIELSINQIFTQNINTKILTKYSHIKLTKVRSHIWSNL